MSSTNVYAGDEVDRDTADRILKMCNVEKSSLDRFLPMYNVAVNICTRMQYSKFAFILLFRPLNIDENNDVPALRLFAIRTFRDKDAEKIRDILNPVNACIMRNIFGHTGGSFDCYADDIDNDDHNENYNTIDNSNPNDNDDESIQKSKNFQSFIDHVHQTVNQRFSFQPDKRVKQISILKQRQQRIFFPEIYVYIMNTESFIDDLLSADENNLTEENLFWLKKSRNKLVDQLIDFCKNPFWYNNEKEVTKLLSKRLKQTSEGINTVVKNPVIVNLENGKMLAEDESLKPVNDSVDYWNDLLFPSYNSDVTNKTLSSSPLIEPTIVKGDDKIKEKIQEAQEHMRQNQNKEESAKKKMPIIFRIPFENETPDTPDGASFYEQIRQSYNDSSSPFSILLRKSAVSGTNVGENTSNNCLFTVHVWNRAFQSIDYKLFTDSRLALDYPSSSAIQITSSYERCSMSALLQTILEFFFTRNKLNDIARYVCMSQDKESFKHELKYTYNFATFVDYSLFVDARLCSKYVKHINRNRIFIPLEWMKNTAIHEALINWTRNRLDFNLVPLLRGYSTENHYFDFRYMHIANKQDERHWQNHVLRLLSTQSNNTENNQTIKHLEEDKATSTIKVKREKKIANNKNSGLSMGSLLQLYNKSAGTKTKLSTAASSSTATGTDEIVSGQTHTPKALSVSWIVMCDGKWYGVPKKVTKSPRSNVTIIPDLTKEEIRENSYINIIVTDYKNKKKTQTMFKWKPHSYSCENRNQKKSTKVLDTSAIIQLMRKPENSNNIHDDDNNDVDNEKKNNENTNLLSSSSLKPHDLSAICLTHETKHDILVNFIERTRELELGDERWQTSVRDLMSRSIEQLLFLDVFFTRSEPQFTIMVNGNPGTGKSTVMNYIAESLFFRTITLLPTNVLKERCLAMYRKSQMDYFERNKTNKDCDNQLGQIHGMVITLSAFVKRVLRYSMSPEMYSNIIEKYLEEQVKRLNVTLRPMSIDGELKPLVGSPQRDLKYSSMVLVDEYNLCTYPLHFIIGSACEKLHASRVYFGDFAQSSPIRGMNDNAELIALYAPLTIQFIDNKRLLPSRVPSAIPLNSLELASSLEQINRTTDPNTSNLEDPARIRLLELLADPVWNWRANNCNDGTDEYVRDLVGRCVVEPLNYRLLLQQQSPLSTETKYKDRIIKIDQNQLDRWYDGMCNLLDWYDDARCRRYVHNYALAEDVVNRVPPLVLPCVIARRNYDCDRVNYWISRSISEYVEKRCADQVLNDTTGSLVNRNVSRIQPECFALVSRREVVTDLQGICENVSSVVYETSQSNDDNNINTDVVDSVDINIYHDNSYVNDDDDEGDGENRCKSNEISRITSTPSSSSTSNELDDDSSSSNYTKDKLPTPYEVHAKQYIDDDPWCSQLTLFVGGVYRYIGESTPSLCRDTILRLIAFLPNNDENYLPTAKRPYMLGPYVCNGDNSLDIKCYGGCMSRTSALNRLLETRMKKILSYNDVHNDLAHHIIRSRHKLTRGCGLPEDTNVTSHDYYARQTKRMPRLLMTKITTRDDMCVKAKRNVNNLIVVNRAKFSINRCNSMWTPNMYTNQHKRRRMTLFDYPLSLNCGVSSWRVQGETIPSSDVYVDLKNMTKQQALVSLSRVRRSEQIKNVINLSLYGKSAQGPNTPFTADDNFD